MLMQCSAIFSLRPGWVNALYSTSSADFNSNSMAATVPSPHWAQKTITLPPYRRGCHLVSSQILKEIGADVSELKCGLAHLFRESDVQHTSASVTINENYDSDVRDKETFLDNIVPEAKPRETVSTVMQEKPVIVVGAGPSGLAMAACLNRHSIPYILLEREDCFASLWKKYAYDRLHLHLDKEFCMLPHLPFPDSYPRFISKDQFVSYLDDYVSHFNISPLYRRCVELAKFDEASKKWIVKARNLDSGEVEDFTGRFLAVASGETSNPYTPEIEGLNTFPGDVIHSTQFKNGKAFRGKNVLVVGSGNSGMEIALDLANHGAKTSIVVRSPMHILSREMVYLGANLAKYIPFNMVDSLMVILSKLVYGDLTKYGITRPKEGPFFVKAAYGKFPVIDVGTCDKIKSREIQVLPAISSIRGNEVVFENAKTHAFDTIIFCTGFKRSTNIWLKGDDYLLNDDGFSKQSFPNHWKGKNGLYCVGLSRRGFFGAGSDAQNIANDISSLL